MSDHAAAEPTLLIINVFDRRPRSKALIVLPIPHAAPLNGSVRPLAHPKDMVEIEEADDPASIGAARALFEEYQQTLGIDLSFQGFATELESLPGEYAPPRGRLLLARDDSAVVGVVAMRPLTSETCEMKRLYVRPQSRAGGVGRQLAKRVIAEARAIGYCRMCLDTLPTMAGAQRLYESLGFKDIPAYRHNPIAGTRFLGLDW